MVKFSYLKNCDMLLCKLGVFVLFLFFFTPCTTALDMDEFLDFVDGQGGPDSVKDIKYNTDTYTPNIDWTRDNSISGWIDIVGYDEMVKKGDIYYVNQSIENSVVVMHDIKHHIRTGWGTGNRIKRFESEVVDISTTEDRVVVTLRVYLKYVHTWIRWSGFPPTPKRMKKTYSSVAYFKDSESFVPHVYPGINDYNLIIYNYNNTVKPKAICEVNVSGLDIAIEYKYHNEAVRYNKYELVLEHTDDKNFPYANLTQLDQWSYPTDNTVIFPLLDSVWMPGDNFSEQDFSVNVHTPYTSGPVNTRVVEIEGLEADVEWINILGLVIHVVALLMILYLLYIRVVL